MTRRINKKLPKGSFFKAFHLYRFDFVLSPNMISRLPTAKAPIDMPSIAPYSKVPKMKIPKKPRTSTTKPIIMGIVVSFREKT